MSESFRLDLQVGDVGSLQSALDGIAERYERIADAQERLGGAQAQARTRASSGASSSAGRFVSGPNQARLDYAEQRTRLDTITDPARRAATEADLNRRERLAQRQIELDKQREKNPDLITGPGLLQLMQRAAVLWERIAAGNGIGAAALAAALAAGVGSGGGGNSAATGAAAAKVARMLGQAGEKVGELVGGAAEAVGGLGNLALIAGAAADGIAVMVTAGKAYVQAVVQGTRDLQERARLQAETGGTAGAAAGLAALGIGAGEARALRERLTSDPLARLAGAQLGLGIVPPSYLPGSPQDNARILLQVVERLRQVGSPAEQLRLARMLGVENQENLIRASGGTFAGLRGSAAVGGFVAGEHELQTSRDVNAELMRFTGNMHTLGMALALPWLPRVNDALTVTNQLLEGTAAVVGAVGKAAAWLYENDPTHQLVESLRKAQEAFFPGDQQQTERDHTAAMKEHAATLRAGMQGGGPRSRAFPGHLRGDPLNDDMRHHGFRAGAFR